MFFIKELRVTGRKVKQSVVDFKPGLNIVYGPSNTGKSYIAECINFLCGGEAKKFDLKSGHERATIKIDVEGNELSISRAFTENSFDVYSDVPDIETGTYKMGNQDPSISIVWLKLMGINKTTKIISSSEYKSQTLTLRTFFHMIFIPETSIIKSESILLPFQVINKTSAQSALLYFMRGENFLEGKNYIPKPVREARKDAIGELVSMQLTEISDRRRELSDRMTGPSPEEIHEQIELILSEIEEAEGEVSSAVEESRSLANEIVMINEQLAENRVLHDRYRILHEQYNADIKRLTFIVEGELHKESIVPMIRCPFCNGELEKNEEESCVKAAQTEVSKLMPQIKDLEDADKDISLEIHELNEHRTHCMQERMVIEERINSELWPKVDELRRGLSAYTEKLVLHNENRMLRTFANTVTETKYRIEEMEVAGERYNIYDNLNNEFVKRMNDIVCELLESCHFENFVSAKFDIKTFDLIVNDSAKSTYGKGYAAFLNTILAIAIQIYLNKYGTYKPGMLIIDSPILSLREKWEGTDEISDGMKYSLFKYLLEHQEISQTIIFENSIPKLDYSTAHLIEFTKDETRGRYGFLADKTN